MRTIIYSLRTVNDKSTLRIDLTGLVISETHYTIQIKLPSGEVFLDKGEYLNKMKVYDDGDVFFIVCKKNVSRGSAFECLMKYAIDRVDQTLEKLTSRVGNLVKFKERLQKEIAA